MLVISITFLIPPFVLWEAEAEAEAEGDDDGETDEVNGGDGVGNVGDGEVDDGEDNGEEGNLKVGEDMDFVIMAAIALGLVVGVEAGEAAGDASILTRCFDSRLELPSVCVLGVGFADADDDGVGSTEDEAIIRSSSISLNSDSAAAPAASNPNASFI